ncbi:MAG: pyridoxal phosphate-dependent aminotransferase [Oligoflexia bacterium]|nr:pyridoxal phosphate-dependent aminotransferase [Oligoflexia bacterium]
MNNAFRDMPYMGVIFVVVEAMKLGYSQEDPSWSNLGQGQPEVGALEGAPDRFPEVPVLPNDYAYGPVEGLKELREAVAAHYNRLYRQGMKSQYSAANVTIAAGGRTTLTRTFAALGQVRLGHFIPDYTAYEDLLTSFRQVTPVTIELKADQNFSIDPDRLAKLVASEKLDALLISNPCNPTGRVIGGSELSAWTELARTQSCTLLMDEYYSHFIYKDTGAKPVSAAAFVQDVENDPVVIIDGLTKNFRYPGWRLGWAVGPSKLVKNITAAGSFVDGGPPRPIQRAAVDILAPKRADQETQAVRSAFIKKRDLTVSMLQQVGIRFPLQPQGTFYAFGDISGLPASLADGMKFFRAALQHKVLTVPGEFFDVNPGKTRKGRSPLTSFVRFSYGPPMPILKAGLERLQQMIRSA